MTAFCLQPGLAGAPLNGVSAILLFSPSKDEGAAPSLNGRVLIVEDEYFVSMELDRWLSAAGYEVVGTAVSADEAIDLAGIFRPDFVLMDIRLLGPKDGVDAALEIFAKHSIRCVFASAFGDQATRDRAEVAQPLGWLSKPYGEHDLVQAAGTAIKALRR
jgi:two-component system, response regulator PdtaR